MEGDDSQLSRGVCVSDAAALFIGLVEGIDRITKLVSFDSRTWHCVRRVSGMVYGRSASSLASSCNVCGGERATVITSVAGIARENGNCCRELTLP